jgi:Cupin-like domain
MRVECELKQVPKTDTHQSMKVAVEADFLSKLSQTEITISNDYYSGFRRPTTPSYKVNANEYLKGTSKGLANKNLMCPEMPVPRNLAREIRLIVSGHPVWSKEAVALLHAGRPGSITPIHFDWDHTWVAHACVIGRKRFFLIPPSAGWLLSPIINTSALAIPRFSNSDRSELLASLGGMEILLEAGQGILFPSLFWHGAVYEEPSLGVSVRFEALPGGRPFAVLPRSWLLQRLMWLFFDDDYAHSAQFLRQYLKSFFSDTRTWKARYRRTMELCRQSLMDRGQQQGAFEWISENFSAELELASEELKLYYGGNVDARNTLERSRVTEIRRFLFAGIEDLSGAQELRLARYALSVRQGLPPKRGLVQIEQE